MAVTVRPARVEDARDITRAHVAAWQVAYRGIFPDPFLDGMTREFEDRVRRWEVIVASPDLPGAVTLVAEVDGTVVGWLSYGPNRDDPPARPSPGAAGPVGEVYGIYVHPDHWRTGAGSALMAEGEAGLASGGFGEATLWVLEDNPGARRFYEHHGWRHDGSADIFERGGGRAIELRYRLPLGRQPAG